MIYFSGWIKYDAVHHSSSFRQTNHGPHQATTRMAGVKQLSNSAHRQATTVNTMAGIDLNFPVD